METNAFIPLHNAHAIEQVVVSAVFDRDIPEEDFENRTKWQGHARKIAAILPAFTAEPGIRIDQVGPSGPLVRTGTIAYAFSRIQPNGTPGVQLRVERNSISFLSTLYSRWPAFKRDAAEYLVPLCKERIDAEIKLNAITLHYVDRFIWNGNEESANLNTLVRSDCKWIAPNYYKVGQDWHCHSGAFVRLSDDVRRLINVNFDSVRIEHEGVPKRSVGISILLTHALNQIGYRATQHTSAQAIDWLFETIELLHSENKKLMSEILTEDMQARVSLGANSHGAN